MNINKLAVKLVKTLSRPTYTHETLDNGQTIVKTVTYSFMGIIVKLDYKDGSFVTSINYNGLIGFVWGICLGTAITAMASAIVMKIMLENLLASLPQ
jgi:hypothetical protein